MPIFIVILLSTPALAGALPPVPYPKENPPSEAKRVLGKILFWDEQLSSDNTVACGTCHRPGSGGGDPRAGINPGKNPGTIDDVHGSPGIVRLDHDGRPVRDPVFGFRPQVTRRLAPSNFGGLWAKALFWDGRASGQFRDPLDGRVAIRHGGALENQALDALSDDVEMAKTGRRWEELTRKLQRVRPLALATHLPRDVARALAARPAYPQLFAAAFGDSAITPVRIAFAIADYERTLVADQTPWDRYEAGDRSALSRREVYGWRAMQTFHCVNCHVPPLFTDNRFFNTGVRRIEFDAGREDVTHDPADAGAMKVPSLRDVGLMARFMHTGQFTDLAAVIGFYQSAPVLPGRDDIPGAGIYSFNMNVLTVGDIRAFIANGLTDPRVKKEIFPFDRPTLRSERGARDHTAPQAPARFSAEYGPKGVTLRWSAGTDDKDVVDYVLERDDVVLAYTTKRHFLDVSPPAERRITYRLRARDAATNVSPAVVAVVDVRTEHGI